MAASFQGAALLFIGYSGLIVCDGARVFVGELISDESE